MNNAKAKARQGGGTVFGWMVDQALSPVRLEALAHSGDWPQDDAAHRPANNDFHSRDDGDAGGAAPGAGGQDARRPDGGGGGALPRATWDAALGEIARDILGRPSRQFRARMCQLAWRLADGVGDIPAIVPALVEVIHAGSLIVDDIEDGSSVRRGGPSLHLIHGIPRALNTGSWMYFWALDLVEQLPLSVEMRHQLRHAVADTMYRCHLGQALDLSVAVGTLPRSWVYRTVATSTMLKTGALMELAASLGAMAAGAPAPRVRTLARFGRRLGLGLQMLDDFGNLNAPPPDGGDSKALEDLRNGRPTWPWARAAVDLDEPTFAHLQGCVRALMQPGEGDGDVGQSRGRALAAELRMAVGLEGRRRTSAYLAEALRELSVEVGDRDELQMLGQEIRRLEASYG